MEKVHNQLKMNKQISMQYDFDSWLYNICFLLWLNQIDTLFFFFFLTLKFSNKYTDIFYAIQNYNKRYQDYKFSFGSFFPMSQKKLQMFKENI